MKKLLACALGVCMLASTLVGCTSSNPVTSEEPASSEEVVEASTEEASSEAAEVVGKDTFGDWAVCESPIGFFWGGTWLFANKDTTKKEQVAKFIEWVTLDSSETGLQAMWANGKFDKTAYPVVEPTGDKVINVMTFTDEVAAMCMAYQTLNPDFGYEFKITQISTTDNAFEPALDQMLVGGGDSAPDLYCAESAFVLKYSKGAMSQYAAAYEDLGIDIDAKIAESQIAPYSVEIGTNADGKVVGLGYQATGGAFIYRRSIAEATWGSADPATVGEKIGAGSGSWDKFFAAAEELKGKGYGIVSGDGDLWHAVENSSDSAWLVDGKLHIDPKREAFMDLSKSLMDNGYHNDTVDWQEGWFADMKSAGSKEILGFFGPAWLINYTILANCGGEHKNEGKDCVASGTVMSTADGKLEFLGGQNMFDVFVPANANAKGDNMTEFDATINTEWRNQVREYTAGNKSKEDAIADFKTNICEALAIEAE